MHRDCVTRHLRSRESPFSVSCKGKARAKPTNCNPMSFQHGIVEVRCRELTVSKTLDSLRGAQSGDFTDQQQGAVAAAVSTFSSLSRFSMKPAFIWTSIRDGVLR
jgi:hypothetical protein